MNTETCFAEIQTEMNESMRLAEVRSLWNKIKLSGCDDAEDLVEELSLTAGEQLAWDVLSSTGWLGFDYPAQAVRAFYMEPNAWDLSV